MGKGWAWAKYVLGLVIGRVYKRHELALGYGTGAEDEHGVELSMEMGIEIGSVMSMLMGRE